MRLSALQSRANRFAGSTSSRCRSIPLASASLCGCMTMLMWLPGMATKAVTA
jgi:hypothetical protein